MNKSSDYAHVCLSIPKNLNAKCRKSAAESYRNLSQWYCFVAAEYYRRAEVDAAKKLALANEAKALTR